MPDNYNKNAENNLNILSKGAFLTTSHGGKVNTMTISWGAVGIMWGRPVFTVMVRHSRFTKELLDKAGEFTVSFPSENMESALNFCGSVSGRGFDKIEATKLKTAHARKINIPRIDCRGTHYECRVLCAAQMPPKDFDKTVQEKWYPDGDLHTFYFGEILHTETV